MIVSDTLNKFLRFRKKCRELKNLIRAYIKRLLKKEE